MVAMTWWLFDSTMARSLDALGVTCPLYRPMFCVVTLAVLALTLICLGHTANGRGPFASRSVPASLSLLQAQWYVGVSAMLVLIVHALREAEAQAYIKAEHWRTDLELALAGSAQIACAADMSRQAVEWRGDVTRRIGCTAESLATVEDVFARVHADDRVRLSSRWDAHASTVQQPPAHLPFRLSRSHADRDNWLEMVDVGSSLSDGNGCVAFVGGVWQRRPVVAG
jgi:hypothetical protein